MTIILKQKNIINKECIIKDISGKIKKNEYIIDRKNNNSYKKCYLILDYTNLRIIHLIITRFLIDSPKKIYRENYILNGIRVMKEYLLPSLENQSCKNFIWILMLGNKANITHVKSLIDFNNSFEWIVLYEKDIKNYARNITKKIDVLITTRIDYDDRIYYDAVNDVRKAINIYKPVILHGYNRGEYYFELDGKYYDFYRKNQDGVMSIFISLIIVLNKVNDIYTVYDLGKHTNIRKSLIKKYKSYGIKYLNYEPTIFDSGDPKFVFIRQNYSGTYNRTLKIKQILKPHNFNLRKFYGK